MIKQLFLSVTLMSGIAFGSYELRKPISEYDIVANSIEYTVRNPIKVTLVSYIIINQVLNGKESLICQGYKWATVTVPKTITNDIETLIKKSKELGKEIATFLKSSFSK